MTDEIEDPVLPVLEMIKRFAAKIAEESGTTNEMALANCIKYMFAYMERRRFEDAPTTGPDVEHYETNEVKVERAKITAAIDALIKIGGLK